MIGFLYYKLLLIVKVISLVCGIKILKNNKIKYHIVVAYYGIISGLMLGYVFHSGYFTCLFLSVIVVSGACSIKKIMKNGESYIIEQILLFQYFYIVIEFAFRHMRIDFYKMFNIYPILSGEYLNYDYTVAFALIISGVLAVGVLIFGGLIKDELCYKLIALFMIVGALGAHTDGDFSFTGEWQDLFLPLLNIEYGNWYKVVLYIIVLLSAVITVWHFYLKKEDNQPDKNEVIT